MKPRKFNSYMPRVNEAWAAKVLNMRTNPEDGPDLIDDHKSAEVKFMLKSAPNTPSYHKCWTVFEHQMEYDAPGKQCYWVLGFYELAIPVKSIRTQDPTKLEELVVAREAFIVHWDWMNRYAPSVTQGNTLHSKWKNTLRYPKFAHVPKTQSTYIVEKGLIHITEKIPTGLFEIGDLQGTPI